MRKIIFYCFFLLTVAGCKEKYELPGGGQRAGYLVIDGVINSGQGPTTLRITRTLALVDSIGFRNEGGASVRVEGEDNSTHLLAEVSDGIYQSLQLTLNDNVKYRLHINTSDGREYLSDYSAIMHTPPIDNIQWERPQDGVMLYINTHDPQDKTLYYRWEYQETWQFQSSFYSLIKYKIATNGLPYDVAGRDPIESQQMYTCWQDEFSKSLLIGSSARLERDTIHLPFLFIPDGSWKISVQYSIRVRQYACSRNGYDFLQRMKKNTEQVGSLFDAQPSELRGNVRCVNDPNELVIGYVDIADAQDKRIFIKRGEVSPWAYRTDCREDNIPNIPDSLAAFSSFIPTSVAETSMLGDTLRIFVAPYDCVDCRMRGYSNKPSFWP